MKRWLLCVVLISGLAFGVDYPGWEPTDSLEKNPCSWVFARYLEFLNHYQVDLEALIETSAEKLAARADRYARYLLGETADHPSEIEFVAWKDVPGYDAAQMAQEFQQMKHHFPTGRREAMLKMISDPNALGAPFFQDYLLYHRMQEIRWEEESAKEEDKHQALYFGASTKHIIVTTPMPREHQKLVAGSILSKEGFVGEEPIVTLVDDEFPLQKAGGVLQLLATVVRKSVSTQELSPLNVDGLLHFNADQFTLAGVFQEEHQHSFTADRLIYESLANPARDEVMIRVLLDKSFSEKSLLDRAKAEKKLMGDLSFRVADTLSYLVYATGISRSLDHDSKTFSKEKLGKGVESLLEELAIQVATAPRLLTQRGGRGEPGDLMPQVGILNRSHEIGDTSLNYDFVFKRRDGKRIRIRFVSDMNLSMMIEALNNP